MSEVYLCLKCWLQTPASELTYLCPACGQQPVAQNPVLGRVAGLRKVKQAKRGLRRLSSVQLHDVRCPRHPELLQSFRCECTAEIRPDAAIKTGPGSTLGIGIVGSSGVGKTLMMLSALHDMREANGVHLLGIGDTDVRFAGLYEEFFSGGIRPKLTRPGDTGGFGWRARSPGDADVGDRLLLMNDLPGQFWSGEELKGDMPAARFMELLHKIVLVLDGAGIAADLGLPTTDAWNQEPRVPTRGFKDSALLGNLLNNLGEHRIRNMDLAIAVSKGDLLWEHDRWAPLLESSRNGGSSRVNSAVLELLEASGRSGLLTYASKFRHCEPFAFSSLGFRPDESHLDSANGSVLKQSPTPIGAAAPIRWLLDPEPRA